MNRVLTEDYKDDLADAAERDEASFEDDALAQFEAGEAQLPDEMPAAGHGQLSLNVGGADPTSSKLSFSGTLDVEGAYQKGGTIVCRLTAVVDEVSFKDTLDKDTGQLTGCERKHKARIVSIDVH